ncbi:hypothetical protein [Hymenobacter tenuis]
MTVKAKFQVTTIETNENGYTQIGMAPVYSDDPNHENKKYWNATPAGTIFLGVSNEQAFAGYATGDEVYVTFDKATGN